LQLFKRELTTFDDVHRDAYETAAREPHHQYRSGGDIEALRQPVIEELMRLDRKRYADDCHTSQPNSYRNIGRVASQAVVF
jgi:hypothetical protein